MGTKERKEREKEMRRQQIQNAAKELFIAKGFNSTTMENIAQKAELSLGTIYQYFRSKEELYASLNMITLQYFFDSTEKTYKNNRLSVEEKIIGFKDAMYDTFQFEPLILRIIFHIQLEDTLPSLSKELIEQLLDLSRKIMTMWADVYKEGVRQGKFREGHNMAHADIMWGLFTGILLFGLSEMNSGVI